MISKKPGKQRKALYKAPMHKKHKLLGARLSKELTKQLKKRTLGIRSGDEVKVMRGNFKGKTGKITKVMLKKGRVFVENIKRNKVSGEEVNVPIHPSNLLITSASMDDKKRKRITERKK